MKVLVTGSAGFIGSSLVKKLLERGDTVLGIDNHNDYYDPSIKEARLKLFSNDPNYNHLRIDIIDKKAIENAFEAFKPDKIVHLAAQAGVRYSIDNPLVYIESNILGFTHILEGCRKHNVQHLVYASSSSVYGANTNMPFSIHHNVDHPLSLYAASKKANELMAHTYSHLYNIPTTGLRFFTVYGPWGRPDMALFKFTKLIIEGLPIQVFNNGNHRRDFTYISDIINGILLTLDNNAQMNLNWSGFNPDPGSSKAPWRIYNIGNNTPVKLLDFISAIEKALGKSAIIQLMPLQQGDVPDTFADIEEIVQKFNYQPTTGIEEGVSKFIEWYKKYFKID
jgi:UDP-glucuronate 4-epimerase